MTKEQQANLIAYGESVGILVDAVRLLGEYGVSYAGTATCDAQQAHRDLLGMSIAVSCAA